MEHSFLSSLVDWMSVILSNYGLFAVYLGTLLFGENGALAAFMLSAQDFVSPQGALLFAFMGSLSADVFWFFIARKLFRKSYEKRLLNKPLDKHGTFLLRMADKHTFLFLTFIKFLVGMRLFLTVYILLKKRISFLRYLFLNIIGTILFMGVLFPVGWLLGKGVTVAFSLGKGIMSFFTLIIIIIILVNFLLRLVTFIITKYSRKIN